MSEMLKFGLKMVEEHEATGDVSHLYDTIKREFQLPHVPNIFKAIAMSPGSLKFYVDAMRSMYAYLTLPESLIAMICFTVAKNSDCVYCTATNEVMCRKLGVDEATLSALSDDLEDIQPERLRAIIKFAVKASQNAQDLSPEDYDKLRAFGISNDEILQIRFVAALAVFSDIVADALKIEVDEDVIESLGNR